ncbi:hypothetical protein ABZ819_34290 [Streptomyces venezuelae]|uniref:hypothetical protein n=1 Tax=Streptomyces venezuelae TaxID=54571 RepID=UPI003414A845
MRKAQTKVGAGQVCDLVRGAPGEVLQVARIVRSVRHQVDGVLYALSPDFVRELEQGQGDFLLKGHALVRVGVARKGVAVQEGDHLRHGLIA